jgi:AcrR family transcriptional regulator
MKTMPAAAVPVRARGEARARCLLSEARRMFLVHGYERTNVNELVRRAGGSLTTLYRYFGGKPGLFAALMDALREEFLTPLTQLGSAGEAPAAFLSRLGRAYLRLLLSPEGVGFYRVLVAEAHKFPEMQAAVGRAFAQLSQHLAGYLDTQVAAGRLQLSDTKLAARQFLEMVKGDAQIMAVMGLGKPMSDAAIRVRVERAVELFLFGCASPGIRAEKPA